MRRIIQCTFLLASVVSASGMDCQGTTPAPNGNPPTPSGPLKIIGVSPNDSDDTLLISGEFGDAQGIVTLGGIRLNVTSWGPSSQTPQQIVCELPRDLSGNLQVSVGPAASNVVQLTKWEMSLASKTVLAASPTQTGQNQIDINMRLVIRACFNNLLGSTAPSFDVPASVSRSSTASVDASGTIVSNPPPPGHTFSSYTLLSSQPQDFKVVYPGDPGGGKFTLDSLICGATRGTGGGLKVQFRFQGVCKVNQRLDTSVTLSERSVVLLTSNYFDTSLPVTFSFDSGFNILAGNLPAKGDPNSTLSWMATSPHSPPTD